MRVPNTIKCKVMDKIMIHELTKLDKKLMIKEPVNFTQYCHNKSNFCLFSLIKMNPEGISWDNDSSGGK